LTIIILIHKYSLYLIIENHISMSLTTIQLSQETKANLKGLSDKYKLGSYENCIKTIYNFINVNDLDPTKIYYGDYAKGLVDLELKLSSKFEMHEGKIIEQNKSLRNWVGGIEKDYLKPLMTKLSILDKISNYDLNKIKQETLNNSKDENPLNLNLPTPLINEKEEIKNDLQEQNFADNSNEIQDLKNEVERLKTAIKEVIFKSEILTVESMTGAQRKIYINMSIQEWDNFNSLV